MAHPAQYNNIELLEELAQKGKIDGVEIGHYSADENYRHELTGIADKYELIQTGGSDFHGLYNSVPAYLGSESTTKENLVMLPILIIPATVTGSRNIINNTKNIIANINITIFFTFIIFISFLLIWLSFQDFL